MDQKLNLKFNQISKFRYVRRMFRALPLERAFEPQRFYLVSSTTRWTLGWTTSTRFFFKELDVSRERRGKREWRRCGGEASRGVIIIWEFISQALNGKMGKKETKVEEGSVIVWASWRWGYGRGFIFEKDEFTKDGPELIKLPLWFFSRETNDQINGKEINKIVPLVDAFKPSPSSNLTRNWTNNFFSATELTLPFSTFN